MSGDRGSPARPHITLNECIATFLSVIEKTPSTEWKKRCNALNELVGTIPSDMESLSDTAGEAGEQWYQSPLQVHRLAVPLSQLLRDPRSSVVKVTCQNLTTIFEECRSHGRLLLQDLFPSILIVHAQTVPVMRTFCQNMMTESLPKVPCKGSLPLLMEGLTLDKSRWVREACALYLCIALQAWNDAGGYLTLDIWRKVGVSLLTSVQDAHAPVRQYAKEGLLLVQKAHPAMFRDLEHETKDQKIQKWVRQKAAVNEVPDKDFLSIESGGVDENSLVSAAVPSPSRSLPGNVNLNNLHGRAPDLAPRQSRSVPRARRPSTKSSARFETSRMNGSRTPPRRNTTPDSARVPRSPLSWKNQVSSSVASPINQPDRTEESTLTVVDNKTEKRPAVTEPASPQSLLMPPQSPKHGVTIALTSSDEETISLLDDCHYTAREASPSSHKLSPTALWSDNCTPRMKRNRNRMRGGLAVLWIVAILLLWIQWDQIVPRGRELLQIGLGDSVSEHLAENDLSGKTAAPDEDLASEQDDELVDEGTDSSMAQTETLPITGEVAVGWNVSDIFIAPERALPVEEEGINDAYVYGLLEQEPQEPLTEIDVAESDGILVELDNAAFLPFVQPKESRKAFGLHQLVVGPIPQQWIPKLIHERLALKAPQGQVCLAFRNATASLKHASL